MLPTVSPRRVRRRALLFAPAALALGPVSGVAALAQAATPELLVRGEANLPGGGELVAWRVVQDVAETAGAAIFERRALGFAVATDYSAPLLVTDEATGSAYRLLPGEAAFVRDGTVQRRESLGSDAVSYLRIALVPAVQATDPGGDRLRFAGAPFAAPSSPRRLTLLRVLLEVGMALSLPATAGEALLLVEQGEATVESAAGREYLATTVGSDTAYAIRSVAGPATVTGQRAATFVFFAVIA